MSKKSPIETETTTINNLLSEFGARLNEIEEKQRLIKDRVLLIGENLISTKEEYEKQTLQFKKEISEITEEIKSIKQLNRRIVNDIGNFARKSEVNILKNQANIFQPLKFAKISDIKNLVQKEIKKQKNTKP